MSLGPRLSPFFFGHPDPAVVAERFRHERELRLVVAGDRNAGRVNLREAGVGEVCAPAVGPPDGGRVAGLGVGGEVKDVAIAAGGQHDGVAGVRVDLAGSKVARDDAAGLAVDDDEVEHFRVVCMVTLPPAIWRSSAW